MEHFLLFADEDTYRFWQKNGAARVIAENAASDLNLDQIAAAIKKLTPDYKDLSSKYLESGVFIIVLSFRELFAESSYDSSVHFWFAELVAYTHTCCSYSVSLDTISVHQYFLHCVGTSFRQFLIEFCITFR